MAKKMDRQLMDKIVRRAHYLAMQMVVSANSRKDKEKGDPKVGGHTSAAASAIHILGALHMIVKSGYDHIANKPHASPGDHAYNYLMDLLLNPDLSRMSLEDCNTAMAGLRKFSRDGEPVFQSYHSVYDPDRHNFFPSGTVGIPPVNAGYLALAYDYAKKHGHDVPDAHFWCILGDSEFREGSLFEATPDFAERQIGNLTWVVDYNRQSLDGHRITNKSIMQGTDDTRIRDTMVANGWHVIEARHGKIRQELFTRDGGKDFQNWLENDLDDYELQALLNVKDPKVIKSFLSDNHGKQIKNFDKFMKSLTDQELVDLFRDFGGNDIEVMRDVLLESKKNTTQPSLIIAHTIKGWGLEMAAVAGNHNMLPSNDEMIELRKAQGLDEDTLFGRFDENSKEGKFLKARGEELYKDIQGQEALRAKNWEKAQSEIEQNLPNSLDINLKMASYPHTQWMLGQLTAKMTRMANADASDLKDGEGVWKRPSELLVSMAPDVGTSTNLNPAMDGKIYGADGTEDFETELNVKDAKTPDLVTGQEDNDRFIRFEIVEANVMSCMGSFGKLRDVLGIPIMPLMTVYDFFVKRAHDQYFYDLYWGSSFIMVGTPAGVTLSPEGAQHGWKSDFQIPNQVLWEPYFCQELDWIFCDAVKRHLLGDNVGRNGVHIRGVTRGAQQKDMMKYLKRQSRFKSDPNQTLSLKDFPLDAGTDESQITAISDAEIMESVRKDVLNGAYYLIDYRNYAGYEPGDNVVNIFSLGALTTEAIQASNELLAKGIYANVIVVTSPDLLVGNLGYENDYQHLRNGLQINATLYLQPSMNGKMITPEAVTLAGRRIPAVSVHDGEPGLLDNIGSIIGVKHESLAVRKHSKCGRPSDVYEFHGIDTPSIVQACGKALSETALEEVTLSRSAAEQIQGRPVQQVDWRNLWNK